MKSSDIRTVTPDVIVADRPCYTRKALAQAFEKSEQTVAGWATRGFGPPYSLIGRRVVYPQDLVLQWLESKLVGPEAKGN